VLESEMIKTSGQSLIVYLLDNLIVLWPLRNFSKVTKPFALFSNCNVTIATIHIRHHFISVLTLPTERSYHKTSIGQFKIKIFIYKKVMVLLRKKMFELVVIAADTLVKGLGPQFTCKFSRNQMIKVWPKNLSSLRYPAKYEVQQFPRLLDCYFQGYKALNFQSFTIWRPFW
jgi:hypothetical protein